MANILTPFGLTPEHFARIDQMKTDPSSFGFKNQFDYARASGKDLVDRSMPGFGIPSMIGQVLATPFYDTYSGIQESKKPYKDDFTQYSGITDYGEMPVGPSLSEVAKGIKDERIGTMMGGRFLGGIDALRERNPGVTGTDYFDDVNISQPPGTDVGIMSNLANLFGSSAMADEPTVNVDSVKSAINAARNREALNKQGLLSLDDAGLNTAAMIDEFSPTSKPRFDVRNFLTNVKDKGIDILGSGKDIALRGIGSIVAGPVGGFVGGLLGNLKDQFENRQLYAPVVDEFGNMYSAEELNKLNALGGYYTDPARSSRRRTARIANLLERQKLGKKFSQKNLNKLLAQKKAEEAAQQAAFNRLNEIRIQRDRDSMSGGVGETLGGTFGSSVNDPGSFSDYS